MLLIASLNVSRPAVEVTSNVAWTASADKDWVSEITPSDGQAADKPATVEIVVAANEEEEPDDEIIPDHRLYVAWTFTTAWKAVLMPCSCLKPRTGTAERISYSAILRLMISLLRMMP